MPDSSNRSQNRSGWWMLAVLWLLYTLSFLDRYILTMLVDPIRADLGLSDFQVSIILGPAFALSYAVATFPLGWAADRFPRRWVAFGGVFVWSLATTASGLAQSFGALLLARICVGVGEAALAPAAYAMLADHFLSERLTTASAIFQSAIKVGSAAAFGVGGGLLVLATNIGTIRSGGVLDLAPWHFVMIMIGAPGFLFGLLIFTFAEPNRSVSVKTSSTSVAELWPFLLKHRALFIRFFIGFSVTSMCSVALTTWTPTYIGRRFDLSPASYGAMLSALSLFAAAALVVKGGIVDWLYKRGMIDAHIRFYCYLLAASIPVGFTLYFISNATLFFIMYGFLQLVMISYASYGLAGLAIIAPPELRGRITAIFLLLVNLSGSGVAAPLVGALTDFVFHDQAKIGMSITVVLVIGMPVALIALWSSLSAWRSMIVQINSATVAKSQALSAP